MDVALADLRVFLALAREGSFTRAGAASFLTPSAISRAVRRLETTVGTELVVRDEAGTHGLTPAGERFVEGAAAVLQAAAAALETARSGPGAVPVRLALPGLGAVLPPGMPLVTRVRRYLRRVAPEVTVHVLGVPFSSMWRALRDDHADVVFNSVPSPDPMIVSTRIGRMERIGLVGVRHPLAGVGSMPAADFARQRLLADPDLPAPWMALWTLDDVRGDHAADLTPFEAPSMPVALARLHAGREALVTQGDVGRVPGPFAEITLVGAPPTWHWADRRRGDRRRGVAELVNAVAWALTPAQVP